MSLGRRIKNIRLANGETMEEFGNHFNTSKGTVNNWEKGRNIPNKRNLKSIADLGHTTVEELIHGSPEEFITETVREYIVKTNRNLDMNALKTVIDKLSDSHSFSVYDNPSFITFEYAQYELDNLKNNSIINVYNRSDIKDQINDLIKQLDGPDTTFNGKKLTKQSKKYLADGLKHLSDLSYFFN